MIRYLFLAAPILLVVAALVALFSYRAITGSTEDTPQPEASNQPTGRETVLRIAVPPQLSCRAEAFDAHIYLDDLEALTLDQTGGYALQGALGVQARVHFDPSVVQAAEVRLPDSLEIDRDGNGMTRQWIAARARIDNDAGTAFIGALAGLTDAAQQGERGADPVAAGEALLIMSLRLHTVGEGRSHIRLQDTRSSAWASSSQSPRETPRSASNRETARKPLLQTGPCRRSRRLRQRRGRFPHRPIPCRRASRPHSQTARGPCLTRARQPLC